MILQLGPIGLLWLAATTAASLAGISALYCIGVGLYRTLFHPLRGFPGPVLASCTAGYMSYYAWRGDKHLQVYRLHQKYGPVVRIGPNMLSFNTSTALKSIYGFRAPVQKGEFYKAFPASKHAVNVHSAIDRPTHARKRKVLSNAFSEAALRAVQPFISKNIDTAVRVLDDQISCPHLAAVALSSADATGQGLSECPWSKTVNAADWCNYLTFDIMGDLAFGKSFHMLDRPENRFAADLVSQAAQRHQICGTNLLLHTAGLDKWLFPSIASGRARYMEYSKKQLTERMELAKQEEGLGQFNDEKSAADDTDEGREEPRNRQDVFRYLLTARDPDTGKGFTPQELQGESNVLIIAGSDTTSTAMAAAIHYILHSPRALERVTREVREAFPDVRRSGSVDDESDALLAQMAADAVVPGPKLSSCVYLRACVDEAMRLSPPVPGYLPREILSHGMSVDGFKLPAGTNVGVPHYAIHHNENYYPRPFEFIPERWIADEAWPASPGDEGTTANMATTAESLTMASDAYTPFSIGPRGCIGRSLAYIELMTSLARLFCIFDVRAVEAKYGPINTPQNSTSSNGELPIRLERLHPDEYPLMDTFTSRKNGPWMQVRRRVD